MSNFLDNNGPIIQSVFYNGYIINCEALTWIDARDKTLDKCAIYTCYCSRYHFPIVEELYPLILDLATTTNCLGIHRQFPQGSIN